MDAHTGQPLAPATVLLIPQRVIAQPQPITRRMIPIVPDAERVGRFTVLSYNVLADLYASVRAPSRPLALSASLKLNSRLPASTYFRQNFDFLFP